MHPAASRLTFIASSCQDESNGAVFLLLVLRVWREGLGAMVEGDGVLVAGANHGAGVPHGRSWGLVLDLPIIRHLQIGCSRRSCAPERPKSETQTLLTDGLVLNLSALQYWSDTNKNNISCLLIMLFLFSVKITKSHITASPVSTAQRTRSRFPVNWNSLQDVLWFLIKRKQRTTNTEIKCFHHIVSFISFKHSRSLIIKNNKNGWKISTNKKRKL